MKSEEKLLDLIGGS